jgi:hypothetical protein
MSERTVVNEIALADALFDAANHPDRVERVAGQIAIMTNADALAHLAKVFAEMRLAGEDVPTFCLRVLRRKREMVAAINKADGFG